jgi:hypothetical protein
MVIREWHGLGEYGLGAVSGSGLMRERRGQEGSSSRIRIMPQDQQAKPALPCGSLLSVLVLESGGKIRQDVAGSVQDHSEVPVVWQQPCLADR